MEFLRHAWAVLADGADKPDWWVAVGTIGLAVVAVFQQRIWACFKHPKLEVSIELDAPDCHKIVINGPPKSDVPTSSAGASTPTPAEKSPKKDELAKDVRQAATHHRQFPPATPGVPTGRPNDGLSGTAYAGITSFPTASEPPTGLSGYSHSTPATEQIQVPAYYFRIRISNSGNERAEQAEVIASELERKKADGSFERVESFLPLSLLWSHLRQPYISAISPGVRKYCDLGHIIKPEFRRLWGFESPREPDQYKDQAIFALDVEVIPNTMSHLLVPGIYRLTILISSANGRCISRVLEINVTGKWFDSENQMFSQGVGITMA